MYYNLFFKYKIISRYSIELALNSIAVLYSNIFYFEKKYFNEKHKEIITHNLYDFVAYYNCGVCYSVLKYFKELIFERALKMSEDKNDLEFFTL